MSQIFQVLQLNRSKSELKTELQLKLQSTISHLQDNILILTQENRALKQKLVKRDVEIRHLSVKGLEFASKLLHLEQQVKQLRQNNERILSEIEQLQVKKEDDKIFDQIKKQQPIDNAKLNLRKQYAKSTSEIQLSEKKQSFQHHKSQRLSVLFDDGQEHNQMKKIQNQNDDQLQVPQKLQITKSSYSIDFQIETHLIKYLIDGRNKIIEKNNKKNKDQKITAEEEKIIEKKFYEEKQRLKKFISQLKFQIGSINENEWMIGKLFKKVFG